MGVHERSGVAGGASGGRLATCSIGMSIRFAASGAESALAESASAASQIKHSSGRSCASRWLTKTPGPAISQSAAKSEMARTNRLSSNLRVNISADTPLVSDIQCYIISTSVVNKNVLAVLTDVARVCSRGRSAMPSLRSAAGSDGIYRGH